MQDVHARIHLAKKNRKEDRGVGKRTKPWDPIAPVAHALASEAWLLCFDEFQVSLNLLNLLCNMCFTKN